MLFCLSAVFLCAEGEAEVSRGETDVRPGSGVTDKDPCWSDLCHQEHAPQSSQTLLPLSPRSLAHHHPLYRNLHFHIAHCNVDFKMVYHT